MPLAVGLVGRPGSGMTTVFEVLQAAPGGKHSASGPGGTHVRTVEVQDERLSRLVEVYHPKKRTPVSIRFVDFPGKGSRGEAQISLMKEVDAFLVVVGRFAPGPPTDPEEVVRSLEQEWILQDLEAVKKRLKRLEKSLKLRKNAEEKKEQDLLQKLKGRLDEGGQVRHLSLAPEERKIMRGFKFLSEKPCRVVVNLGEGVPHAEAPEESAFLMIRGQVEKEIAELAGDDRGPFLKEMGVTDPAWHSIPRACLEALDVVTFYTIVGEEVRAWTLSRGSTALDGAGKIHADMARGFVRAEVLPFEDFAATEGPPPEKRKGRLEGKQYVVQDGDILTIRFSPT